MALSTPAWAQQIPIYDVEAFCQKVKTMTGGSETIRVSCIEQQQQEYDALKPRWASLPETVRDFCNGVGEMTGGSYQMLAGCVDQEMRATAAAPKFKP